MKFNFPALVLAAILCCTACVDRNYELGGSLIPVDQTYKIYRDTVFLTGSNAGVVSNRIADSLSGYSNTRITIGAIRDEHDRLTTRACAMTLVPMYDSVLNMGTNRVYQGFKMIALRDSVSMADKTQANILQNVRVYELEKALDPAKDFDCNAPVAHKDNILSKGIPVVGEKSNLIIRFNDEYGKRLLELEDSDVHDMDTYLAKFPGIYIETDKPEGQGGRIDIFDLQLAYSSDSGISGNFAELDFNAYFPDEGKSKDTTLLFYFGTLDFYDVDSLLTNSSSGSYPQYALNLTTQESEDLEGTPGKTIYCEGGGGLKPVISAKGIRDIAADLISAKGGDPAGTVINKASLVFPFEYDPAKYEEAFKYPDLLSPTCRIRTDTTSVFMGLTDSSSDDENQGDIDRFNLVYAPDITYHMQELLKMDDKKLDSGNYDIWLLNMSNEVVTTTSSSSSSDLSEYYQYLAYQQYYNSMYGGYGYGSYGYSSYGYGNSYSNYYSYMLMMSMYSSSSSTTTSTETQLDKDRYYWGELCGPQSDNPPMLILTYSIPNSK